jgi:hypothetical protein
MVILFFFQKTPIFNNKVVARKKDMKIKSRASTVNSCSDAGTCTAKILQPAAEKPDIKNKPP